MRRLTFYTDGSTAPGNPGPSGYGFYGGDETITYSGYGPVGRLVTNNVAELMAVKNLIDYLLSNNIVANVVIYSDSEYIINILKTIDDKAKNNWKTLIGSPMANQQYWKDLYNSILKYRELNGSLIFQWVKGHNGTYENEVADTNANKGRAALINGDEKHVCDISSTDRLPELPPEQVKVITAKKKIVDKLNGLFAAKRWFFRTNIELDFKDNKTFYLGMSYPNDKKLDHKNAGKRNPNTNYCILITENRIDIFDQLKLIFDNYYSSLFLPVVVELSNLCSKKVWNHIVEYGHEFTTIKDDQALHMDCTVLGKILQPPRKSYALDDIFTYGFNLLERYHRKDTNLFVLDITSNLVDTSDKNKKTINNSFTTQSEIILIPGVEIAKSIITDIKLLVNLDIFSRTNLLQLINEKKNVKIEVMVFDTTSVSYRVATIVTANEDICIYFTPDANYRFVTQYENNFEKTKIRNFIASSKLEGIELTQPVDFISNSKKE